MTKKKTLPKKFKYAAWKEKLDDLLRNQPVCTKSEKTDMGQLCLDAGLILQRIGREAMLQVQGKDFHKAIDGWMGENFPDETVLLFDGFEAALLGVSTQFTKRPLAIYDLEHMVNILVDRDGMSREEAEEFISFNTTGAWIGEQTPEVVYHYNWEAAPEED